MPAVVVKGAISSAYQVTGRVRIRHAVVEPEHRLRVPEEQRAHAGQLRRSASQGPRGTLAPPHRLAPQSGRASLRRLTNGFSLTLLTGHATTLRGSEGCAGTGC